jgi:peptidoglycan-associated lipoprotein
MTLSPNARLAPLAALALAAALAGCSSTPIASETPAPVTTATPAATTRAPATPAQPAAVPQSQVATVDLARQRADQDAAALRNLPRTMYFDFDSFVLRDEYKPAVEGYAKALGGLRSKKLALEGHADERGGREYNLALGQKRAEAVARAMELLGVGGGQIEPVSFGEERPSDAGHDEAAWAKNRRVEVKDR